jgi:DNA-binding transcriptional ArsR family regulator
MPRTRRNSKKFPKLTVAMESEQDFENCAARLKALADPDRLQLVNCLLRGPKNVTDLAAELDVSIVKASHHLRILRYAQVVQTQKRGKYVIYSLHPELAARGDELLDMKTLDLGCCRLDLLQPPGAQS